MASQYMKYLLVNTHKMAFIEKIEIHLRYLLTLT